MASGIQKRKLSEFGTNAERRVRMVTKLRGRPILRGVEGEYLGLQGIAGAKITAQERSCACVGVCVCVVDL